MARATTTKTTSTPKRKTAATPKRSTAATKAKPRGVTKDAATPIAAASQAVTSAESVKKSSEVTRELKKKELVERVAEASGLKKSQARAALEEALGILGDALAKGEQLNLEPLGKLRVVREKDVGAAHVYTCRVRRRKASAPSADPLAAAAE
ncbi:MAG: HU family DNA-binding protein [Pseudomonadota bacterium]